MERPLVILSDLHLSHAGSESTAEAFVQLLNSYAGHEFVLAGDIFGLSSDPPKRDPVESVTTLLRASPNLLESLGRRLAQGEPVTLLAGNHDAAIAHGAMRGALLDLLGLNDAAPLSLNPWFVRRGGVHIEHGHLWDPDNAPAHPLSEWTALTEPLGIALTRRFVARRGVWEFAHAHETTLVRGLKRAFDIFGPKAPLLVAHYFATSARICVETLFDRGLDAQRSLGDDALALAGAEHGVPPEALRQLIDQAPDPTHTRFNQTFLRLYYDRVLCSLGLLGGAAGTIAGGGAVTLALAAASCAYLALNVKRSGARYENRPIVLLRDGADIVRSSTGADTVVFGHTHVPEVGGGYANSGSFGYPEHGKGRPFLLVDERGRAELRRSD